MWRLAPLATCRAFRWKPADVAGTAVFASPAADCITGQNIRVNGGRTYS